MGEDTMTAEGAKEVIAPTVTVTPTKAEFQLWADWDEVPGYVKYFGKCHAIITESKRAEAPPQSWDFCDLGIYKNDEEKGSLVLLFFVQILGLDQAKEIANCLLNKEYENG